MDTTLIIELATIIVGTNSITGVIVGLVTIRYRRRKEEGESHAAIYEGMKVEQDTYQQMIGDMRNAYNGQLEYIAVLTKERKDLLEERGILLKKIDELKDEMDKQHKAHEEERRMLRNELDRQREEIIKNGDKVARLGRIVRDMKPDICSRRDCKTREQNVISLISDMSFETENENKEEK
jgi:hypothetical protein